MNTAESAILASWRFDGSLCVPLALATILYVRGWLKLHYELPGKYTPERLASFCFGVALVFLALTSPLDAFGNLLLQAHMMQHLLLIMAAPPLILLGQPVTPLLRGLPRRIFRDALGPFLASRGLKKLGRLLTHPVTCFLVLNVGIVFWHLPRWYELALHSPGWHKAEHLCFLGGGILFWWPVIEVWPAKSSRPRWLMIPYLVLAEMANTPVSAWLIFNTGVVYPTYAAAPRLWGISAMDDQAMAGALMWVPGSIILLVPAFLITMSVVSTRRELPATVERIRPARIYQPSRGPMDLLRLPVIGVVLRWRHFRRVPQTMLFALAVAVIVSGFRNRGSAAPLTLAGVLPWVYWRGFAIVALLAAGNLFCMACPFMFVRDFFRRFIVPTRKWPVQLRSKWLATALLCVYFWAYEVFSLWNSAWLTAWIICGYFITAVVIDSFFEHATFCRYLCPIGQFNFVASLNSPLEVRPRSVSACTACRTHDCVQGNATHRGCESQLFQPVKQGSVDCTFCLDCVQACPSDNIGLFPVIPAAAIEKQRGHGGLAVLVSAFTAGALVNAAGMVGPVTMWMHGWHARLHLSSMMPVTTVFYLFGIIFLPALAALVCGVSSRLLGRVSAHWKTLAREFAMTFAPLGFAMWAAHFGWHLITGWGALAAVAGRASPGSLLSPASLSVLQVLILDCGLLVTLYRAWRLAKRQGGSASGLMFPWAALATVFYSACVWVLYQPMQMRGMVMPQ